MLIKNRKTDKIVEYESPLGKNFRNGNWRDLTSEEITQYTTKKEADFLLKEKVRAISAKEKELLPKTIIGTITQQEKDELQNLINS